MLLSVTGRLIVPRLPSPPPCIHNLSPFSLLWPGKHHCIEWIYRCSWHSVPTWYTPIQKHKITWNHARTYKGERLYNPHMCICECIHAEFVLSGGLTKLFLSLSFGIHYGPGLLSESLYCLREVPICGSMWQGGSKSPLMNQYVGGLSLWRGRPRNAILHPGKNVCICSHQTLLMSADI